MNESRECRGNRTIASPFPRSPRSAMSAQPPRLRKNNPSAIQQITAPCDEPLSSAKKSSTLPLARLRSHATFAAPDVSTHRSHNPLNLLLPVRAEKIRNFLHGSYIHQSALDGSGGVG